MTPDRQCKAKPAEHPGPRCHDCGLEYGQPGFQDLIIPNSAWRQISPTGDEGGTLCANCICARLEARGMREIPGAFMSGPVRTVPPEFMEVLRWNENTREELQRKGVLDR